MCSSLKSPDAHSHDISSVGIECLGTASADLQAGNQTAGLKVQTEAVVEFELKFEFEHLLPVKTALPPSKAPSLRLFRRVWR